MSRHNKKRNVGIIYEQIVSFICDKSLENDKESTEKALKIIESYFCESSQLKKELKLFNALANTRNVRKELAGSIIKEAKKACNYHFDSEKLQKEKSKLIKELNYSFGKGEIFKQKIKNYRSFATIQTLLNEWRKEEKDLSIIIDYESKLFERLSSNNDKNEEFLSLTFDPLTHSLMKEKFNKKYTNILSESQAKIISNYYNLEEDEIIKEFEEIKKECLSTLRNYKENCDNKIILEKYDSVYSKVKNFNTDNTNQDSLKKVLHMSKLIEDVGDSNDK